MTWNHDITAAPRGEEKNTVVQILKDARALIADEENWTQCFRALDGEGKIIDERSRYACKFCSVGAIARVSAGSGADEMAVRDLLRKSLTGGHTITSFNDTHTHAEVLALFDRAIARAESEAA